MSDSTVENARRFLRAHTTASLSFDEHFRPVRYVIEPSGHIVFPCMVAMLRADETVLYVPDENENEDAMQLLVTLEPLDENGPDGAATDRWRIYHGEPEDVRWTRLDVDAGRFAGHVLDGEGLVMPNPLAGDEPALCRRVNADRARLREICTVHIDVEAPVLVGIDSFGFDIRRKFDVARIEFPRPAADADDALTLLEGGT